MPKSEVLERADAVAHVARCQDWAAQHIPQLAARRRLSAPDIDLQNAEWAAADAGVQLAVPLDRMERAWDGLRAAVVAVPEPRGNRDLARLVEANTWEHYDEHREWRPAG